VFLVLGARLGVGVVVHLGEEDSWLEFVAVGEIDAFAGAFVKRGWSGLERGGCG